MTGASPIQEMQGSALMNWLGDASLPERLPKGVHGADDGMAGSSDFGGNPGSVGLVRPRSVFAAERRSKARRDSSERRQ
jgi:hypothetical protein